MVVRPLLDGADDVVRRAGVGQPDDRHPWIPAVFRRSGTDLAEQLEPLCVGEIEVDQQCLRRAGAQRRSRLADRSDRNDREPVGGETSLQERSPVIDAFHHQHERFGRFA